MKTVQPLHLVIGGCALAMLGSCLPWVSLSARLPGTQTITSVTGMADAFNRHGIVTLVAAAAALVLSIIKLPGKTKVLLTIAEILGGLILIVGFHNMIRLSDHTFSLSTGAGSVGVSISLGLYLVVIGGLLASIGAFMRRKSHGAVRP